MKLLRIQITSGEHTGRYVGPNTAGGLITNPELQKNREVKVPGINYSLYVQESPATKFFEGKAQDVQAELKQLGYESELVAVE